MYRNPGAYQRAYDVINRLLYWEKGDRALSVFDSFTAKSMDILFRLYIL